MRKVLDHDQHDATDEHDTSDDDEAPEHMSESDHEEYYAEPMEAEPGLSAQPESDHEEYYAKLMEAEPGPSARPEFLTLAEALQDPGVGAERVKQLVGIHLFIYRYTLLTLP